MRYDPKGKRLLDLFFVFVAGAALAPVLIIISICIKLFDPGPVIFRQKRVGRDGQVFVFYKFRSMPVGVGDFASDEIGNIRLTWIGKLIRVSNIDELPQLLNIMKGDMSIVVPRPPIPSQRDLIEMRKRDGTIKLVPGLTGLAQVSSFDGMSVARKAKYDRQYAFDISFKGDLIIILRTIFYLFKRPPVY